MTESYSSQEETQLPLAKSTAVAPKIEFWYAVIQCMEGKPKIDFEKLAGLCGYKNATTANTTYNTRRRAITQSASAAPISSADEPKPKRGRKPKVDQDGEPPKKRKRGRPPKTKVPVPVSVVAKGDETEAETEPEWDEESGQYRY